MKIAVEGCAHGELEKIYDTLSYLEQKNGIKVDLLICCGDFQSTRNSQDLECMAVPPKYRDICTFYKYYSGEKEAPILTIFIGGNHEASNYLSELAYGGWVAPNIYYLGYAGVVQVAGIRIAGLSGIFKGRDYKRGHFEKAPFNQNSMRSVYHIRNLDVFRLKQLSGKLDIALSHDWPSGVYHHGNLKKLLQFKPFFQEDIKSNRLGSEPAAELLHHLKPSYWFSAHLHCKFSALIRHISDDDDAPMETTRFLALDKCLPRRRFLQVFDLQHDEAKDISLDYDLEWLSILSLTNHLLSVKEMPTYMPGPGCQERWKFTPTAEELEFVVGKFSGNLKIPLNFIRTVDAFSLSKPPGYNIRQPYAQLNPQTTAFCNKLGVDDPIDLLLKSEGRSTHGGSAQCSMAASYPLEREFAHSDNSAGRENSDSTDFITSKPTLQGMKLPSPKMDLGINNETYVLKESASDEKINKAADRLCSSTSELSEENPYVESRLPSSHDNESSFLADPVVESTTPLSLHINSPCNEGPQPKKFKRRNEAIYSAVDEDE